MMNLSFLILIFFFTALLMAWGFKQLPREQWQFFAAVPVVKQKDGTWKGMNLTYYGIFSANAYIFALAVLVILLGACSIPAAVQMTYIIPLLGAAVPAARIVAWMVEKKSSGFTVGGASFVAILLLPWVVAGVNLISSFQMPVFCFFAAVALAYSFGEGLGRLACISFGFCYGKSLANSSRWIKRIFSKYHFIFQGKTKKIAYPSCLDNQPIIPVQAVTAVIYTLTGLIGTALFLYGHFKMSLGVTLVITQLWRVFSEFFRDDFNGKLSIEKLEKLLVLFDVFEGLNGARNRFHNETWQSILKQLTPDRLQALSEKYNIRPMGDASWIKGFTGGSDDHAGYEKQPARGVCRDAVCLPQPD